LHNARKVQFPLYSPSLLYKIILSNHNNSKALSIFVEGKKNIFVYGIDVTKTIGRVKGSKNASSELLISSFEIASLKDKRID